MKTNVTCPPVAEKSFFTASLLRVFAILLILVLSIFSSCNNVPENAGTSTVQTTPTTTDFAYQYNQPAIDEPLDINGIDNALPLKDFSALTPLAKANTKAFTVDAKRDTVVVGNKGVMVHIPANSFDLPNPNAEVKIEIQEYTSQADFFFSGLTTTSNGQLLESGGTVYVSATVDGKEVKLKEGSSIELAFPNAKPKPDMQTFYGEKTADGTVNWLPALNSNAKPFTNYSLYDRVQVTDTIQVHINSTLYKSNFLIQTIDGRLGCLRFEDTTKYKNVLEYFNDKFTLQEPEYKLLKGSVIEFAFVVDRFGKVLKVNSEVLLHNKYTIGQEYDRKEALKKVRAAMVETIKKMPTLYGTFSDIYSVMRTCGIGRHSGKITLKSTNKLRLFIRDNSSQPDYIVYSLNKTMPRERTYTKTVYNKERADSLKNNDARYCFLKSEKLGWINCDRFYGEQIAKTNITIDLKPQIGTEVKIIFKDIMSVMHVMPLANREAYGISNIPTGTNVKYVAIQNRIDGLYFAVKDANTNQSKVSGFAFKPMTVEAIKKELAAL